MVARPLLAPLRLMLLLLRCRSRLIPGPCLGRRSTVLWRVRRRFRIAHRSRRSSLPDILFLLRLQRTPWMLLKRRLPRQE